MADNDGLRLVHRETVSNVTATIAVDQSLGEIRHDPAFDYIYLYNVGTTQINPGDGCVINNGSTTGYSVTVSSLSGVSPLAAVVVHATATTATYFWGAIRGYASGLAQINTAATAGQPLMLSDNGAFRSKSALSGNSLTAIAGLGPSCGMVVSDITGGETNRASLKAFFRSNIY